MGQTAVSFSPEAVPNMRISNMKVGNLNFLNLNTRYLQHRATVSVYRSIFRGRTTQSGLRLGQSEQSRCSSGFRVFPVVVVVVLLQQHPGNDDNWVGEPRL